MTCITEKCVCSDTHTHTLPHTLTHTHTHTHSRIVTHHTHTLTITLTLTHTHPHTHTHARTHMRTWVLTLDHCHCQIKCWLLHICRYPNCGRLWFSTPFIVFCFDVSEELTSTLFSSSPSLQQPPEPNPVAINTAAVYFSGKSEPTRLHVFKTTKDNRNLIGPYIICRARCYLYRIRRLSGLLEIRVGENVVNYRVSIVKARRGAARIKCRKKL